MKPYDPNRQTALDMTIARNRTSITVENVRNFLHREFLPYDSTSTTISKMGPDGYDAWERRRKIVDILQGDPVFDRSQRLTIITHGQLSSSC